MTAPLLATRDALVAALRETISPGAYDAGDIADYLLESGVVRDPATLADDEALVDTVTDALLDADHTGFGDCRPTESLDVSARRAIRALAAALTEDPS